MHDPGVMRFGKAGSHLLRKLQELLVGERRAAQELTKVGPLDELHHDVMGAFVLPDVVNLDDVRMVERRGRTGLLLEASKPVVVGCKFRKKGL